MAKSLPKHFKLKVTEAKDTGIRLFGLRDTRTGVMTYFSEFNQDFDVHATIAWAGARTSRSTDAYSDIFAEIVAATKQDKYSAGEKLAKVFVNYGHASVADMSPVMIYINNIPMHQPFWLFNHTSVGAGQELSTRYVEIGDFGVPSPSKYIDFNKLDHNVSQYIQQEWDSLLDLAATKYKKWLPKIKNKLSNYLSSSDKEVNKSTLNARTLDIVRMWVPLGSSTSMTYLTSTRNWIDLIVQLREHGDPLYENLAEQINTLINLKDFEEGKNIKANLHGLTKYSEGKFTIKENLLKLRKWLNNDPQFNKLLSNGSHLEKDPQAHESQIHRITKTPKPLTQLFIMQQIISLYPSLSEKTVLTYLKKLSDKEKAELGRIVLNTHMHHNLMRNIGDVRGELFAIQTAVAYARDLNRHRAMGRFMPILDSDNFDDIVYSGYNSNYQFGHMKVLSELMSEWYQDMSEYYSKLYNLYEFIKTQTNLENYKFIQNLFLLAHQVKIHLSGPITQLNYLNSLRISLGGDFGYRDVVYQVLNQLRQDPYLKHMLPHLQRPDVNNIAENLGRS